MRQTQTRIVRSRLQHLKVAACCVAALCSTGCTVVGRGLGSVTASKYAKPEAGITWNVPAPELDPSVSGDRTVFLSVRNISSAPDIDIRDQMKAGVRELGYRLVNNPDQATYRLRVSIRYFGENELADGGARQAALLGGITGAAAGVGTGVAIHRMTKSRWGAGVGGGLTGAVVGIAMKNATTPREWDLIADVILEEKLPAPIEIQVSTGQNRHSSTGMVAGMTHDRTQAQGVAGGQVRRISSGATVTKRTRYFPHGVRVTGWARQIGMTADEAMPLILSKLGSAPANLLP